MPKKMATELKRPRTRIGGEFQTFRCHSALPWRSERQTWGRTRRQSQLLFKMMWWLFVHEARGGGP